MALTTAEKRKMEEIVKAMTVEEQELIVKYIQTAILWNECEMRLTRESSVSKMQGMAREVAR